jgi:hypothetical protein
MMATSEQPEDGFDGHPYRHSEVGRVSRGIKSPSPNGFHGAFVQSIAHPADLRRASIYANEES